MTNDAADHNKKNERFRSYDELLSTEVYVDRWPNNKLTNHKKISKSLVMKEKKNNFLVIYSFWNYLEIFTQDMIARR